MDIVDRLRGLPIVVTENGRTGISTMGGALLCEAADEIERLQREIETLKESRKTAFDASIERLKENERFYNALKKIADRQIEDDDAVDAWAYCKSIAMIAIDGDE